VIRPELLLLVKLVAVPMLVLSASLAARKWGPAVGGLIIGLPLTSGPVLVFLAIEQGVDFASAAAVGTLLGVVPLALYCSTFSRMGLKSSWKAATAASTAVYFLTAGLLSLVHASLLLGTGAALLAIAISLTLMPKGSSPLASRALPWWEIPSRMVAATFLVVVITEGASVLGPRWSGLLAPYPIYATVFAVFMLKYDGPNSSAPFLRGVLVAALAATAFFLIYGLTVTAMGVAWAVALSILATSLVQGTTLFLGRMVRQKATS
jgi:hypothetical protein